MPEPEHTPHAATTRPPRPPAPRHGLCGSEVRERQRRLRLGAAVLAEQSTELEPARRSGCALVWRRFLAAWERTR
jgi:hypothetical protein